jgi:molybdenum cofactor synthesis domain-containing protein
MDGYALRARDVAGGRARLRVVGVLMAGDDPGALAVGKGEAVRIMTGAALPSGADAVCMVEHTSAQEGWVLIEEAVAPGTNVRRPGEDIAAGDEVFAIGESLGPAHIGVLASLGVSQVYVFPRPRVGVISTGDELARGPGPLAPGKIRDSNRPALLARLRADGFPAIDLGWAGDEAGTLAGALVQAAEGCDAVLTTGGVSVGDRDIVKVVLEELGGRQAHWWQVAVRPGKPFAFATFPPRSTPVFGLPGNPVSALVSYELFARPALRLMAGHQNLERPRLPAVAAMDMRRQPDGRLHLVRVTVTAGPDGLEARPSGGQGSHQLRALAAANALALLPDGEGVAAGERVEVWVLDPDRLPA